MEMRASSYGQNRRSFLDKLIAWVRVRKVLRQVKQGSELLDLGCGYRGELLFTLKEYLKEGVGVDLSVDTKGSESNIQLVDARVDAPLPFPDSQFDTVTALAIIEHVDRPETMLTEAYRVLKPGGKLMLTTPSLLGKLPLELMAGLGLISREEIQDHKRYYTRQSLSEALMQQGWQKLRVKHFGILWLNLVAEAIK